MRLAFLSGFVAVVLVAAVRPLAMAAPEERIVPTLGSTLVRIPPGNFTMGSAKREAGHRTDEDPRTMVTLTHAYWLGRCEITQGEWKRIMGRDAVEQARRGLNDDRRYWIGRKTNIPVRDFFGWKKGDDPAELVGNQDDRLPILWVSWNEAAAFCRKIDAAERAAGRVPAGYEYRLPTEAEWEYACRAGTQSATYAGDMLLEKDRSAAVLDSIAWYAANSGLNYSGHRAETPFWPGKKWPYPAGGPHPVGTKAPNAWGLYDMLGNAAEWCLDWNGPLPGGHVYDPSGPRTGLYHVRKGGSWSSLATQTRAAYRNWHEPTYRWINLGFRIALAPMESH